MGTDLMEESLEKARVEEGPAEDAVRRLIAEAWTYAPFLAFLYGENPLHGPGELDDAFVRIGKRATLMFERGQREGVFRTDLPAAWMSEAMWVLVAVGAWSVAKGHIAADDGPDYIVELLFNGTRARARA
ncbi:hypothetical protein LG943_26120 [Streptomonospora sp. S1-112]|nr:hypothetical protein [Streptomonospora mangrovi]MDA0567772.1 hypothetical protein [Streptomonospora mangrovi]